MRRHEVRFVQTAKQQTHDGPSPAERTSELLAKLDGEVQALTDSETWQRYVRFGTGHVFDISQTDGDEAIVEWGIRARR